MSLANFTSYPPEVQEQILNTPAGEPPQNVSSETVDGELVGIVLISIFTVAVTILGLMRLYARCVLSKNIALEDYIGFTSFIPFYATVSIYGVLINRGDLLLHQWEMTLGQFFQYLRQLIIFRVTYSLVMLLAKTGILIEWNRIFVPNRSRSLFFRALIIVGVLNIIVYLLAIILTLVSCVPTNKIWQPWVDGTCFQRGAADNVSAWTNLVVDLSILILPQREIWRLHLSTRRKFGVSLIFSVGVLVCATAAARLYRNMTLDYDGDVAYDASVIITIGFAEITGVLVVFCVPGVALIFTQQKVFHGVFSSLRSWTRITGTGNTWRRKTSPTPRSWIDSWQKKSQGSTELDLVRTEIATDKDAPYHPGHNMQEEGFKTVKVHRQEEYARLYGSIEQIIAR